MLTVTFIAFIFKVWFIKFGAITLIMFASALTASDRKITAIGPVPILQAILALATDLFLKDSDLILTL